MKRQLNNGAKRMIIEGVGSLFRREDMRFTIPGEPTGKARPPRVTKWGAYTPGKDGAVRKPCQDLATPEGCLRVH